MRFATLLLLLCPLPSLAQDKPKAPPAYFKVEIRGTLRTTKIAFGSFEPVRLVKQAAKGTIEASGVVMRLDFGDNKELAELAKTLDGKTVLISGELRRSAEKELTGYPNHELEQHPTAGPPLSRYPRLYFVDYVLVTSLKAAE